MLDENKDIKFIEEKIKSRPLNRKRLFRRMAITVTMAIIFSTVACFTFFFLEPIISDLIQPEEPPKQVVLPDNKDELTIEDMLQKNDELVEKEDIDELSEKTNETLAKLEEMEGISSYEKVYKELKELVRAKQKSLVTIETVTSGTDWFNNPIIDVEESTGFILANNEKELIIIAQSSSCDSADEISVVFSGGARFKAVVKQFSKPDTLVALAIALEDIPEQVLGTIDYASLGNSHPYNIIATPIIAIGGPNKYTDFVAYGLVTSTGHSMDIIDRDFLYFTTDIASGYEGNGVIVNTQGNIIGLITNTGVLNAGRNIIKAVGISQLYPFIERLSNGKALPELGLSTADIPQAFDESVMPSGAFVVKTKTNSPAMRAGIQAGDIITHVGAEKVGNSAEYVSELCNFSSGDRVKITYLRESLEEYQVMENIITLD